MKVRIDMIIDVPGNMSLTEIEDLVMDGIVRIGKDKYLDVDVYEFIDIVEI